MKNKSEHRAKEILQYFVNLLISEEKEFLEAIILVGSLSNGSYIEGPGRDIDQITILKSNVSNHIIKRIFNHIDKVEEKFNKDIPISKTVYRLSEMQRPFLRNFNLCIENKHLLEVTTELQRIHESGVVLYGNKEIISKLSIPTREEVIYFNTLGKQWSEEIQKKDSNYVKVIQNPPIRILVQIVLTNAMTHYFYATGKSCSNKHEIAFKMKTDVGNYRFQKLLDSASDIKINPNRLLTDSEKKELRDEYLKLLIWKKNKKEIDEVPLI